MGTTWSRSDFEGSAAGTVINNPDERFWPHAVLVSPNNIQKQIAKEFEASKPKIAGGDYRKQAGEEIVETSVMSSDDFRAFYARIQGGGQ